MNPNETPGLGELLRYVSELVEFGAEEHYRGMRLNYRARYTPILRALKAGAETVTDITARCYLTQGAISQTIGLMEADGLILREALQDGRKSRIRLSSLGRNLGRKLEQHWRVTFAAIETLEDEIGHPLRKTLAETARALEQQGFSARLTAAKAKFLPVRRRRGE